MKILDHKAYDTFCRVYRGDMNFITPDALEYGSAGDVYYELSEGTSIISPRDTLYCVTVLSKHGKRMQEHNKMFYTCSSARGYIDKLQDIFL